MTENIYEICKRAHGFALILPVCWTNANTDERCFNKTTIYRGQAKKKNNYTEVRARAREKNDKSIWAFRLGYEDEMKKNYTEKRNNLRLWSAVIRRTEHRVTQNENEVRQKTRTRRNKSIRTKSYENVPH